MKVVLPGAAIGLLGGGANSRMFAMAAHRMGYRVNIYEANGDALPSLAEVSVRAAYENLDRIREFASAVDVVTVVGADVPLIALQAAANCAPIHPSASVLETIENGVGAKRNAAEPPIAEFSIAAARGADGLCVFYPPAAVDRVAGAVDIARSPAPVDARIAARATELIRAALEDLKLIGVACIELSLTPGNELLIHEIIPHPHSTGYWTMDACVTGQFEQQLRAVCGLPLGGAELLRPAATAILRGDASRIGDPGWASACALPEVKLHLYGIPFDAPRPVGHLTATATSATLAKQIVRAARASLSSRAA